MFNLFKSKASVDVIAKIHNEFNSAADLLLAEAKNIINNKEALIQKAERLKAVGFHPEQKEIKSVKDLRELQTTVEAIMYFQQYYPFNKFITEKQVEAICKKYNLLFTEIRNFKGFVPEKNLQQIEKFVLREDDYEKRWVDERYEYTMHQAMMGARQMQNPFNSLANIANQRPQFRQVPEAITFRDPYEYKYKPSLKICAPEKDIDMTYLKKSGYKTYPDPVVLQPVKGGYLIVTAWGDEATDEIVINEINN